MLKKKKLNDKAFELNNKLIDKDNALNDINKKLIEKDYLMNEMNNKLEAHENKIKALNEEIKGLKISLNKLMEEGVKNSEIKDLKLSLEPKRQNYNKYNLNIKNEDIKPSTPKNKSKCNKL